MLSTPASASKPKNWMEWFKTRESSRIINASSKKKLFETFDASISKSDCIQRLLKYDEVVFLYKQNMGTSRINVFHHMKSVGGMIHQPEEDFGAIEGIGENTIGVITPSITDLINIPLENSEPVPKLEDYMKVSNTSDAKNLVVSQDSLYKPRNFIPIPPFLLESVERTIDFNRGDATELLLRVIEDIKDFDLENSLTTREDADESCQDLLHWLFLVAKNKIYSTPSIICYNKELRKIFTK